MLSSIEALGYYLLTASNEEVIATLIEKDNFKNMEVTQKIFDYDKEQKKMFKNENNQKKKKKVEEKERNFIKIRKFKKNRKYIYFIYKTYH
jgi:hypothetical protein